MPNPIPIDQLLSRSRKLVKSQSAEALTLSKEARQLAIEQNSPEMEAAALCLHAQALLMLGRHDETQQALELACLLADQHSVGHAEGDAQQLLGRALFERSQYLQASECWRRCLMLPHTSISTEARARAHLGLGLVHLTRERFDMALEQHRMAEELALESDNRLLHSDAQLHVAADLMKLGHSDDAMTLLKDTLPQVRAEKSYEMEADIYGLIGEIHLERGETGKAQTSLMVALKINRLAANLAGETANLISLGMCEMACHEIDSALEFLDYARSLALETESKRMLSRVELALSQVYLAANQPEAAAPHAAEHARLREEMLHPLHKPGLGCTLDGL